MFNDDFDRAIRCLQIAVWGLTILVLANAVVTVIRLGQVFFGWWK